MKKVLGKFSSGIFEQSENLDRKRFDDLNSRIIVLESHCISLEVRLAKLEQENKLLRERSKGLDQGLQQMVYIRPVEIR